MKLRNLEFKDIGGMLEWMKDPEINRFFRFNAEAADAQSVKQFITNSQNSLVDRHFAIADDNNEYIGTISLKNIDNQNATAEYAIILRKTAQGTGAANFATNAILRFAFDELNLNKVYLNVLSENTRAIQFYEKFGFIFEGEFKEHLIINNMKKNLKWYRFTKGEYKNGRP